MKIKQYQVDAFTSQVFTGNPAAVCFLDAWLPDKHMQAIAQENNLSETAFVIPSGQHFALRWFTPVSEIDLCGHATLASAHVLFKHQHYTATTITFQTRSGILSVTQKDGLLQMDFPCRPANNCAPPDALLRAFNHAPSEVLAADDYLLVFENEARVRSLQPDFSELEKLDLRGVIITAPGTTSDFVSRFFAPKLGIQEDPVTGSAHCTLAPYWVNHIGKSQLSAKQVSPRGGDILCEIAKERVLLSGNAVTFMEATLTL